MNNVFSILVFFIFFNSYAQTCQTIDAQLDSSLPVLNPDGLLQVCTNGTITLEGSAVFSDNNTGAVYEWDLGDGNVVSGTTAIFSYNNPGVYIVNLRISGVMPVRCTTSTNINLVVQVADRPDFRGTQANDTVLCFGESTTITGTVAPVEVAFNCTPPVGTTTALPDGLGIPYETSVFVDCYDASATITDVNQITSICLNLEHSYLGDLDIDIISPDGRRIALFRNNPLLSANLGIPWAVGEIDASSNVATPGIGSEYCFLPDRSLPSLEEGVRVGGTFTNGNGPGTYIDNFVPAGNYRSLVPLTGLVGSPLNGEWKISIVDNFEDDNGNIFEWQITFDSGILPPDFSITPAIVTESWDADASITNTAGSVITVAPTVVGDNCYTYRVVDEFGCEFTEDVCIEMIRDITIETQPADIVLCDVGGDGIETFDFTNNRNLIIGGQPVAEVDVSFHANETDAVNNDNELMLPYSNTAVAETIWARIADITQRCYVVASFNIEVVPIPIANTATTYQLCDNNLDGNDTNGNVEFDLSTKTSEILGTQNASEYEVKFYNSQAEANTGVLGTEFSNTITNTLNPQPVYARIEHRRNRDCFATSTFNLLVNPLPVINNTVVLTQCDDDADGISNFNLTEANTLISSNAINETFTYYTTLADAENAAVATEITNATTYQNPNPISGSSVYARVENSNGCYRVSRIDLIVGVSQIPSTFTTLEYFECDTKIIDNDDTNGIATFDFSDATQTISNLFPAPRNFTLTFYTNEADALAEINAIADSSNHRNDASPFTQNIYVRIDSDNVNACLALGHHITLNVNPLPETNSITDYEGCSDSNTAIFDLTTKTTEVIGTQIRPILVSYHETLQDAIDNMPILNPNAFTSTDGTTIYVRAQFDDNGNGILDGNECVNTDMSFQLTTIPNPVVFSPDPIVICNDQVNTVYDLTLRAQQITGGDASIVLSYFETQTDLDNNNPIADPSAYTSSQLNETILVVVVGANGCTITELNLDLNTILYDSLLLTPMAIEECEIDNNGFDFFDITRRESLILNGLNNSDFTFDYYENRADAEAGNPNFIVDVFNFENTQPRQQTLFVRVTPITNDCYQIIELPLIVNPVPEIQIEDEYVICLAPDDSVIPAANNVLIASPPIDTQLSAAAYSFEWYTGLEANPSNVIVGETSSFYIPTSPGDYTVIATNLSSGCTIPASTSVFGSYPPERITVEVTTDAFSANDIISVSVEGNGVYEFSLDDGPWQTQPVFENVTGGEHTVNVRDVYNCDMLTSESLVIIDYPRFFTPNGDGFNDSWQVFGINDQADAKIYIYDRYGKLLKQLIPTEIGWDGTFNGALMPTDGYWFTVEFNDPNKNNTRKLFKAHFTLKR